MAYAASNFDALLTTDACDDIPQPPEEPEITTEDGTVSDGEAQGSVSSKEASKEPAPKREALKAAAKQEAPKAAAKQKAPKAAAKQEAPKAAAKQEAPKAAANGPAAGKKEAAPKSTGKGKQEIAKPATTAPKTPKKEEPAKKPAVAKPAKTERETSTVKSGEPSEEKSPDDLKQDILNVAMSLDAAKMKDMTRALENTFAFLESLRVTVAAASNVSVAKGQKRKREDDDEEADRKKKPKKSSAGKEKTTAKKEPKKASSVEEGAEEGEASKKASRKAVVTVYNQLKAWVKEQVTSGADVATYYLRGVEDELTTLTAKVTWIMQRLTHSDNGSPVKRCDLSAHMHAAASAEYEKLCASTASGSWSPTKLSGDKLVEFTKRCISWNQAREGSSE